MKFEDLTKLKVSLPHKRKAQTTMIALKKVRTMGIGSKNVSAEQVPEAVARVVLPVPALLALLAPIAPPSLILVLAANHCSLTLLVD